MWPWRLSTPPHPDPCADCLGRAPGHYRNYFEINPVGFTQAPGVQEPRPVHGGLWNARYVERPANQDYDDISHVVGSGMGLAEALSACVLYADTDGRGWLTS